MDKNLHSAVQRFSRSELKPLLFTPINFSINSATLTFKKAGVAGGTSTRKALQPVSCAYTFQWGKRPKHAGHWEQYKSVQGSACHSRDFWSAQRVANVVSENIFQGMQCPRGEEVLRSKRLGNAMCSGSVSCQMQSFLHPRADVVCSQGAPSQGIAWQEHCGTGTPVQASIPAIPAIPAILSALRLLTSKV